MSTLRALAAYAPAPLRRALHPAIQAAGLKRVSVHKGDWAAPADYDAGQDLWVVAKA